VDSLHKSLAEGIVLIKTCVELINHLELSLNNVQDDVIALLDGINGMCPRVRYPICIDISDSSTCDTTGIFESNVLAPAVYYFETGQALLDKVVEVRDEFLSMLHTAEVADENIDNWDWTIKLSKFFSILLALLCVWILVGLFFRLPDRGKRWQKRYFFPVFVFLVVVSFVLAIAFIFVSIGVSDACVDSPDDKILAIMDHSLDQISPLLYEFVSVYLSRKISIIFHLVRFAVRSIYPPFETQPVCLRLYTRTTAYVCAEHRFSPRGLEFAGGSLERARRKF
jgi:hypothetical protein